MPWCVAKRSRSGFFPNLWWWRIFERVWKQWDVVGATRIAKQPRKLLPQGEDLCHCCQQRQIQCETSQPRQSRWATTLHGTSSSQQRIPEKLNNPVTQKVKRACRCQSPTQEYMRDPWSSVMMKEGYEERVREYVMCWFTSNSISLLVEPVSFSFVLRSILWYRQSDDRPYKQFSYIWLQKQYEKEKEILWSLLHFWLPTGNQI